MFEFCCLWNIAVRSITFSYRIRGWYTWVHIEGYPRLFVHRTGILVLYLFPVSCANMRNLKETKKESHGKTDGYLGHRSIPDIKTLHSPSFSLASFAVNLVHIYAKIYTNPSHGNPT